jgi:hypothetical protein
MKAAKYSPGEIEQWKETVGLNNAILLSIATASLLPTHFFNYFSLMVSCKM